ncbi:GntR family transcriptional regulator [Actinoplanes capillaceus]|uniref:GntR family transcriptional regulator n=1 Tax=Actinoplanes campanulatus TaxID=113559 RepID=A0ABQ3WAF1_9ACTN|nr:GntR family transcriptional regulator [Actinoplanes capillaceus]GID44024.1 GntR family transcriptional regulator [Actinoplanes capillaceus]
MGQQTLAEPRWRRADRARQIADVLRHQVLGGVFRVLPGEAQLCHDFEASRNTVREALGLLAAEGLVARQPGVGTLVVTAKYAHGLHRLAGLAETLHEHGEITNEVRTVALVRPPAVVARRLRIPDGEQVVYLERVRSLDGIPVSLDLTYLPQDIGVPLLAEDLAGRDVFVLIEELTGQSLGTADISIEAVNADPHSADLIGVADRAALLMIERVTHLADGRPVDLEWIRFRGDRLTLVTRLSRISSF